MIDMQYSLSGTRNFSLFVRVRPTHHRQSMSDGIRRSNTAITISNHLLSMPSLFMCVRSEALPREKDRVTSGNVLGRANQGQAQERIGRGSHALLQGVSIFLPPEGSAIGSQHGVPQSPLEWEMGGGNLHLILLDACTTMRITR